ncbi:MAG TPA: prepilin-type N-terminal cleavage/methylation domain-containing protein [Candidatus Pacearchaeota archaeon]|nr:prepilin-type N-terminal cleavage/methylation domain-containing protein [Candidatus Pacearchaeota archaeon]
MPQNIKSFTLIEILITIVIIGILAGAIMISTSSSVDKTRDGIRRNDLGVIARALRSYQTANGVYPVLNCRIGTTGCLSDLVPKYLAMLPTDPASGYYGYSSTGSEFMLLAKGSTGPITYTDSNGFDNLLVAVSYHYGLPLIMGSGNSVKVEDSTNQAFWGYVNNFDNGWASDIYMAKPTTSYGFKPGNYDIYMRLRTNGLGAYPTSVTWGIYNSTTAANMYSGTISGLTTSYQTKFIRRITLSEANMTQQIRLWFSDSSHTDTQYYVDYVEFRKVN